jgi:hypothetical protein
MIGILLVFSTDNLRRDAGLVHKSGELCLGGFAASSHPRVLAGSWIRSDSLKCHSHDQQYEWAHSVRAIGCPWNGLLPSLEWLLLQDQTIKTGFIMMTPCIVFEKIL